MTRSIQSRPTPWETVILICGKCARKLDGGFGVKREDTLRKALRSALKQRGSGRAVRIFETRCMGICPKKAVIALNASRPGSILTVPAGANPEDVIAKALKGGGIPDADHR